MASSNATKKFLQQVLTAVAEGAGFNKNLSKLRIVSGGMGKCTAEMKVEQEHTNRAGILHGGLTATLVDAVSTMALMTTEQALPGVSVDINVSYISAAKTGEEIIINAETLRVGRNLAFLNVDVINKESGALIAKGSHTKYVG
ncbi:acyl-coenzyme A thioesterase 13 [Procambarus clarkii]|uniref:acyl-coenzyme A thioesterase 13 n=1 Tax=Procambarus clarkii TaxID=6728 RepID=UPI001E678923|nr:acyl-coenzyme A thioesterase 13-like [Procambarus clarkii]XP_045614158.1 acyl-coenzyme A thioesterase 13-like [Procambarus clarkii]XP_045614159.1 acyl-coenzyme A thioesterase 13-like [Procambarus clarkii]XP_045614160.1 acyl-coenzyme A thioesterase 13-like [Procambarus clarkii]XP_045614161.1 acyl-coenzyme A thioesterase 13-like [Procambarus clarkii]